MDSILPIAIVPASGVLVKPVSDSPGFFDHVADHFIPHSRNNYHPHIFSNRMTGLLSILLVVFKLAMISAVVLGPAVPAFSSAISAANIISLTNQSRTSFNLPPLQENNLLDVAAQNKANDMLAKGYFAHNTPDGKTPWDFITAAGYNYITAGENLAVNFIQAEDVETAWMNSPEHKANILNGNFQNIGIGVSQGTYEGHTAIFVVQMFGTLADEQIALTNQPTVVQQVTPTPKPASITQASQVKHSKTTEIEPVATPAPAQPINQSAVIPENGQQSQQPIVTDSNIHIVGDTAVITTQASSSAVKIIAALGLEGVMLEPMNDQTWQAIIPLRELTQQNTTVTLKAYAMNGAQQNVVVAEFAGSTPANYSFLPQMRGDAITIAHMQFSPSSAEARFYLLVIAGMLSSLILAIAVKRHVQHIGLITNGSFVIILACLLYMVH